MENNGRSSPALMILDVSIYRSQSVVRTKLSLTKTRAISSDTQVNDYTRTVGSRKGSPVYNDDFGIVVFWFLAEGVCCCEAKHARANDNDGRGDGGRGRWHGGDGGGGGYTGASLEGQSMVDYCNWGCNGKNRKQGAEEEKVK